MFTLIICLLIIFGCSEEKRHGLNEDGLYYDLKNTDDNERQERYNILKENIENSKNQFLNKTNEETEKYIVTVLTDSVFHFWYDTPWDFNGITQKPGEGEIACGYFVTTTLLHSGFKLERVKLAQQAASIIIQTLCNKETIKTFTNGNLKGLKNHLEKSKNGIYIIGLDNHVGFIHKNDTSIVMIHADYINDKVSRERLSDCRAIINSKFHMIGNFSGNAEILNAWRKNEEIRMKQR